MVIYYKLGKSLATLYIWPTALQITSHSGHVEVVQVVHAEIVTFMSTFCSVNGNFLQAG
jgi:hypothetical protein